MEPDTQDPALPKIVHRDRLVDGVVRIVTSAPSLMLSSNSYLIDTPGGAILIDPGPSFGVDARVRELAAVAALDTIVAVILTQPYPDAYAGLDACREAGITAPVWAHWWTAVSMQASGCGGDLRPVHGATPVASLPPDSIRLLIPPPGFPPGLLMVADRLHRVLFTGDLLSSVTASSQATRPGAVASFTGRMVHGTRRVDELFELVASSSPNLLAPHHGPTIDSRDRLVMDAIRSKLDAGTLPQREPTRVSGTPDTDIEAELARLRSQNAELQHAIVVANDDRIKDATTNFYNEAFLRTMLPAFFQDHRSATVIIVRPDSADEDAMAPLATELVNAQLPDALRFRIRDYSCLLLVPRSNPAQLRESTEELINVVRESVLFPTATTASVALGSLDDMVASIRGTDLPAEKFIDAAHLLVHRLATSDSESLVVLGDTVGLDELNDASRILVVTADRFLSDAVGRTLNALDLDVTVVDNGTSAIDHATASIAAVVIEQSVPQRDGFQVRRAFLDDEQTRDIPFIMIVDVKSPDTVRRAIELEITHVLEKPVNLHELGGICRLAARGGRW